MRVYIVCIKPVNNKIQFESIKKHSQINNRIFAPKSACNTIEMSMSCLISLSYNELVRFFCCIETKFPYVTRHLNPHAHCRKIDKNSRSLTPSIFSSYFLPVWTTNNFFFWWVSDFRILCWWFFSAATFFCVFFSPLPAKINELSIFSHTKLTTHYWPLGIQNNPYSFSIFTLTKYC